jgi:uncharacterized protein YjgD (DUF1641 family)
MAKAIRHIEKAVLTPAEEQSKAMGELLQSAAESRDAIKMFMEILKEAHQAGLLEMLDGLLKARGEVGQIAIQQLNQPNMHYTLKNVMGAVSFLGKIQPEHLGNVLDGVSRGFERVAEQPAGKPPSIGWWGMLSMLRDPGVQSVLNMAIQFARGFGEHLQHASEPASPKAAPGEGLH